MGSSDLVLPKGHLTIIELKSMANTTEDDMHVL
jgi:hypothetical protein